MKNNIFVLKENTQSFIEDARSFNSPLAFALNMARKVKDARICASSHVASDAYKKECLECADIYQTEFVLSLNRLVRHQLCFVASELNFTDNYELENIVRDLIA